MRRLVPYVAVLMVYLMTPGAGEITENAIHLVASGHMAHAVDYDDHEPAGDEHGCSGPYHVCQCHRSADFTVSTHPIVLATSVRTRDRLARGASDVKAAGFFSSVFRPPRA